MTLEDIVVENLHNTMENVVDTCSMEGDMEEGLSPLRNTKEKDENEALEQPMKAPLSYRDAVRNDVPTDIFFNENVEEWSEGEKEEGDEIMKDSQSFDLNANPLDMDPMLPVGGPSSKRDYREEGSSTHSEHAKNMTPSINTRSDLHTAMPEENHINHCSSELDHSKSIRTTPILNENPSLASPNPTHPIITPPNTSKVTHQPKPPDFEIDGAGVPHTGEERSSEATRSLEVEKGRGT
ncbi:hypothetical protein LguiA_003344 [Lonicera macranthoides]